MVVGGMLPTYDQEDDQYELPSGTPVDDRKNPAAPASAKKAAASQSAPSIVYLMSVLSAMGGFLFGYDTGIVSGAMVFVRRVFNLNSVWQEVVVSITILGAWILSLVAGSLSEEYGRKTIILWASVIFTIGSIVMGFAWSKYILLFGRLTVGCAIGLASTVVPMYIAEVAPTNIRGSLVTLNNCFITFGQLTAAITAGAFSYDHENGWRWMLALAAIPAVVQFGGFMFMPESPRWLIRKQRDDEALVALTRIRGKGTYVLREFEKLRQNQLELLVQEERRKEQKRNIIVAIMKKTATRRALIVGCLLQAIQQLAGINTVMYYTATIIEMSGVQSQSIAVWLAVPTVAVCVIFSFCGYLLADRMGRRPLTLGSLMGVIISLLVLGTGFHLTSMNGALVTTHNMTTLEACYTKRDCASCISDTRCGFCYDAKTLSVSLCLAKSPDDSTRSIGGECSGENIGANNDMNSKNTNGGSGNSNFVFANHICPSMTHGIGLNTWLVLTGLVMYLAAFAPGMGPMPWTINSEIYPMWARSFCYSIATSVNWMFNLLISLTFISLTEVVTTHGAFYMYAIIASIGWLLLFWKLPETRGRSLEDISSLFAKSKPDDHKDIIEKDEITSGAHQSSTNDSHNHHNNYNQRPPRHSAGQDNLAFATENLQPVHLNMGKTTSSANPLDEFDSSASNVTSTGNIGRSRSFKLANSLTKGASFAISQPDLQQQQPQQQLQQSIPPTTPPNNSQNNPTTLMSQKQQMKRKYSEGAH